MYTKNTKGASDEKEDKKFKDKRSKKRSYKGRKNSNSAGSRSSKTDVTTGEPFQEFKTSQKGSNDASWYARNPQLLADSASFSFNTALGSPVGWDHSIHGGITLHDVVIDPANYPTFPGILAIHYANFPGLSRDKSSAINIAARNIYSFVRHTNSGHANYDSPDLMMYLMAMDSLYSYIAYLRRVYGTARIFSQKNYYYQRALTAVQGVDYASLISNLSDFRAYINTLSAKASAFAVPSSMPIMQRHFFMASNVYKDRDSEKSQLYIFQPEGFHIYSDHPGMVAPFNQAGGLVFKPFKTWNSSTTQLMDLADLETYGDDLINALLMSEDIGIMSGDILKAFGGNIFTIPATPEEYTVMPVFDPEVLSQIQNSRSVPSVILSYIRNSYTAVWDALDVVQNPNTGDIMADFESARSNGPRGIEERGDLLDAIFPCITMNVEHPTPADVMVATRLTQMWNLNLAGATQLEGDTSAIWTPAAIGTEVVLTFYMCFMSANGSININNINATLANVSGGSGFGERVSRDAIQLSNFNNHPLCLWGTASYDPGAGNVTIKPFGVLGDVDTYRIFSDWDLGRLNQTALLSLYGVPALGTY